MIVLGVLVLLTGCAAITAHRRTPFPLLDYHENTHYDTTQLPFTRKLPHHVSEHTFEQRLDHDSDRTFPMRYWKSERHYQPGGPIFALLGGETSGEDRLEFIDTGILDILAKATHGMGLIVEHRYYGKSVPVPDFTTENLKWLTTSLALEDNVYFSRNVDLGYGNSTSSTEVPWIWYGGSYAGAQAAFLRHLYPGDVFGAIASSGVVNAQTNFWEYFEPIKANMPRACSKYMTDVIEYVDATLMMEQPSLTHALKSLFGLPELRDDRDFVNALTIPLGYWQQQQWTEPVNHMLGFCDSLTAGIRTDEASAVSLSKAVHNYANYMTANITNRADGFSTSSARLHKYDLSQTWRLWLFQVCTEWGYHMPAPPATIPSIISRLLTLEYVSSICRTAYTDAPQLIPAWPRTEKVNQYGSFGIASDRLMIVDGTSDPWLYATGHSPYAPNRQTTPSRPFSLIDGGFHHSDEYGSLHEPEEITRIHSLQVKVVKDWLAH